MSQHSFRLSRRGYEPADVDEAVKRLNSDLTRAQSRSKSLEDEVTQAKAHVTSLTRELDDVKKRLSAGNRNQAPKGPASFADLGERIGQMLTLAKEESDEIIARARTEAASVESEASKRAQGMISHAERESADVMTRTQADAAKYLEDARQRADEILERANEESTTRRQEAEAIYEDQRAKSAAAAADFERNLADRRRESSEEFERLAAQQEEQLSVAETHLMAVKEEAETLSREAQEKAQEVTAAARREAEQTLATARERAEQIRKNSDRELALATARRDSITAQLANVRQMLSTLSGGGDPLEMPEAAPPSPPAPESRPATTSNKWRPIVKETQDA